jgi:hypothetical protein
MAQYVSLSIPASITRGVLIPISRISTLNIPFPTAANALLVKQVIEVDKPLRPTELRRTLEVEDSTLVV